MAKVKKHSTKTNAKPLGVLGFFARLKEESGDIVRKDFPSDQPNIGRIPGGQLRDLWNLIVDDYPKESADAIWNGVQNVFNELSREDQKVIIVYIVEYGNSNFFECALKTNRELVNQVLDENNANNEEDRRGKTLVEAAKNGNVETVKLLLEKGGDVNACNRNNTPLLIIACRGRHDDVVRILIENNADVNRRGLFGADALLNASCNGSTEIVKLLLKQGARIEAPNAYGETALNLAKKNGHREIVKLLREHGAKE